MFYIPLSLWLLCLLTLSFTLHITFGIVWFTYKALKQIIWVFYIICSTLQATEIPANTLRYHLDCPWSVLKHSFTMPGDAPNPGTQFVSIMCNCQHFTTL